jgi:hypothetical protein
MSWRCICIVAPLKPCSGMKIASKNRIVGALMPLVDKKPGRLFPNGPGISVWNWDINWNPSRYVPLSLLLPFLLRKIALHLPRKITLHLPPVMSQQKSPCRSNKVASLGTISCFSLMALCVAPLGRGCMQRKSASRPMGACGWSMQRVSATVERANCVNSVSGMAAIPKNPAGEVGCCILSKSAQLPCNGMTGAVGSIVEPVENSYATNALTYSWSHPSILTLLLLHRSFLVHSVLIPGSAGKNASHAIRLPLWLVGAPSPSSEYQNALRPRWVY